HAALVTNMEMHTARGRLVDNRFRMHFECDRIAYSNGRSYRIVFTRRDLRLDNGNAVEADNLFRFRFREQRAAAVARLANKGFGGELRVRAHAAGLLHSGWRFIQALESVAVTPHGIEHVRRG